MLTEEKIQENIRGIKSQLSRFIDFSDDKAILVNNYDWLGFENYIDFIRKIGPHFTVNRMLTADCFKIRMEKGLSFLEFNYMILQAYDYMELSRRYGCRLQMGGSDQWGNIVNGIELTRRCDSTELFGVTTPLITKADGSKMGKSVSGAVWLHEDQLSHHDYWQFWRNSDDRDVGKFMRLFTDIPLDEIARLEKLEGAEINEAKKILANEATALCRGREAAEQASETARKTFEEGDSAPTVLAALAALGFVPSNKEGRRKLAEGAVRINGEPVSDPNTPLAPGQKLSLGNKKHGLIV